MEAIVFYFLMQQIYQFKAKSSEINKYSLCLGNILGDFLANNMKKNRIKKCAYDFSVEYKAFDTSDSINIRKYLMKKHDMR